MSYNQKVWLNVLVLCSVFWLVVISSIFSVYKAFGQASMQSQPEFTARYAQHYHGAAAPSHSLQAESPTS